jgi:hypothetical protein
MKGMMRDHERKKLDGKNRRSLEEFVLEIQTVSGGYGPSNKTLHGLQRIYSFCFNAMKERKKRSKEDILKGGKLSNVCSSLLTDSEVARVLICSSSSPSFFQDAHAHHSSSVSPYFSPSIVLDPSPSIFANTVSSCTPVCIHSSERIT